MTDFNFLTNPNLPDERVLHTVVSSQYPQVISALSKLGIMPLTVTSCTDVLYPLRNHSDMLFSYVGNGNFAVEQSQTDLVETLEGLGLNCLSDRIELESEYPYDITLNCCIVGEHIICKSDNTPEILKNGRIVIDVKQGYAKCSCVPVDDNSVITDDLSIYNAVLSCGIDAVLVSKGFIRLDGFDTGFIGGCCGKISKDIITFCGDISKHPDYVKINSFLRERKVYPHSLFDGELIDIGSIIPITQY